VAKQDCVSKYSKFVLNGKFLAIDPSSGSEKSKAGFAYFKNGQLIESGIVDIDHTAPIAERLDTLYQFLSRRYSGVDLLVVEKIRGKLAHIYLTWSVGVTVAATRAKSLYEMNTQTWKKYVPEGYEKSDTDDAVAIGNAAIAVCEETRQ
jgi:hypothetical protein